MDRLQLNHSLTEPYLRYLIKVYGALDTDKLSYRIFIAHNIILNVMLFD